MAQVNFTKAHFDRMCSLLVAMLLSNDTIQSKLGSPINAVELLHTTTINSLNGIRLSLAKKIETLENQDEWVATQQTQRELEITKSKKELVNLVIGYKRYSLEKQETAKKKAELTAKLKELKESQKSPEDKIKELEAELSSIDKGADF